jgi:hypothetical protein
MAAEVLLGLLDVDEEKLFEREEKRPPEAVKVSPATDFGRS